VTAVLTADTDRAAWLEARRRGIGASEIAAVLGISPWESPFSLYWRKVNGWDFEPTAEMEWGTRLEDAIAEKYAALHFDDWLVRRTGLMTGPEPWMLATPDRLLDGGVPATVAPGLGICGVLELKTAHSAHDGWGEAGTAEIPVHYRAQVQWQMLVVDVQWADVAVLIGGTDYREYEVLRDERDIRVMVEAGRRFMARIDAGDPPPLDDHSATMATLHRLHPDLDDTEVEVDSRIANGYLRAVAMQRKAEAVKRRYEIELRAAMGRARRATSNGSRVATRTISEIAERTQTVAAHRRDYLTPPRSAK
jgi:putative phage-type endonuclease